jgi:UDP-MurNAc hydroxylase
MIKFINHACVEIAPHDESGEVLLTDPWFSGTVFNHSWNLLADTDLSMISWDRLRHIWISHEHPDHLNFAALKEIRNRVSGPIKLYYRAQANKNVKQAVEKIGFEVVELEPEVEVEVMPGLTITTFWHRQDTAAVFRCNDSIIINQNDCQLTNAVVSTIMRRFKHVDVLLFQFSIAGYCANADDQRGLRDASQRQMKMIEHYAKGFNPRIYVPFASFIYFCKEANRFLNASSVRLEDVAAMPAVSARMQICAPGDVVRLDAVQDRAESMVKMKFWRELFDARREYSVSNPVDKEVMLKEASAFIAEVNRVAPGFSLPPAVAYFLSDLNAYLVLDYKKGHCHFSDAPPAAILLASMPSDEMLFFLKFPWGADTLNISSTFYVNNEIHWRWSHYLKHLLYAFHDRKAIRWISAFAFAAATVRTLKRRLT